MRVYYAMQSLVSRLFEALEVGTVELATGTLPNSGSWCSHRSKSACGVEMLNQYAPRRKPPQVIPVTSLRASVAIAMAATTIRGGVLHIVSSMKPTSTIPKSAELVTEVTHRGW